MRTNLKFALWIVTAALIAVTASFFIPANPVRQAPAKQAAISMNSGPDKVQLTDGQLQPTQVVESFTYANLVESLKDNPKSIKRIVFENGKSRVIVERVGKDPVAVTVPDDGGKQELRKLAALGDVQYDIQPEKKNTAVDILISLLPIMVLLVGSFGIYYWFNRRQMAGPGPGMGRSNTTNAKDADVQKVTFNDVAGCDEAVKELKRIVKGFVGQDIYDAFGAELPRGILLVGPPGTGKTLLAKAVAGECEGTFEIASGSDFVEMYVGVGASRVRDLFKRARENVKKTGKPHVIFIDEIDAVGGKRGGGIGSGGNQEREQTLNQILVEMDGMKLNTNIIIMAATNRADMLDDALVRPGRFGTHIPVELPDKGGREKIFAIHTRNKKLASDCSLNVLAIRTYGYSGAEIKGACDRAAIIAAETWAAKAELMAKEGKAKEEIAKLLPKQITLSDFDEGIDFVKVGGARQSSQAAMPLNEKRNTAYHEAGHACVASALKGSDPVMKITIMRRSRALGYVMYMPESDRYSYTDEQALSRIITAMAGRAAQEVYLNQVDTGASNDFEQATGLARQMVTKWGMSRLGHISVGDNGPSPLGGMSGGGSTPYGQRLADEIDAEWRRITQECYKIARYIVETDRDRMEKVTAILLDKETILQDEWRSILETTPSKVDPTKIDLKPAAVV